MSFWTTSSLNLRPIRRLTANRVFCGLVTAWRLAALADQDLAVVRVGDDGGRGAIALGVLDDLGLSPSMTATQELVVPRSIPMILPMLLSPLS
jgi:hypothetical protein